MYLKRFLKSKHRQLKSLLSLDFEPLSLDSVLQRWADRYQGVQTVIDVGAAQGKWSTVCKDYFPTANHFLIEARAEHEPALQKVSRKYENFDYIISAAGDSNGEIYFAATDDLYGGQASQSPEIGNKIVVPMVAIDTCVLEKQLPPTYFLKLDTHGFEVPILKGALETLKQTELLLIETYNFELTDQSLRFHEMCQFLEEQGFRALDICEPLHRPGDQVFWQVDLLFTSANRELFRSNTYM